MNTIWLIDTLDHHGQQKKVDKLVAVIPQVPKAMVLVEFDYTISKKATRVHVIHILEVGDSCVTDTFDHSGFGHLTFFQENQSTPTSSCSTGPLIDQPWTCSQERPTITHPSTSKHLLLWISQYKSILWSHYIPGHASDTPTDHTHHQIDCQDTVYHHRKWGWCRRGSHLSCHGKI